ncbi:unnamed protein product [Fusarium graminearum]|nr:unnamed protein product [Fusarium graminearum]CAG1977886.1 unnamed protein product [Fusarium graminearum]CAG1989631.1 unnamed protein product [Fusarium graminearum]
MFAAGIAGVYLVNMNGRYPWNSLDMYLSHTSRSAVVSDLQQSPVLCVVSGLGILWGTLYERLLLLVAEGKMGCVCQDSGFRIQDLAMD